jgi:4-nitrophenyl phosphatase
LPSQDPADNTLSAPGEIPPDPSVGAVLVGLDTSINYTKLSRAFRYLHSNPECAFLATNDDSTFPSENGLLPGAGAILAPLVTALGPNRPVTAIGKPNSTMLDAIKAKWVFHHRLVFPAYRFFHASIGVFFRQNADRFQFFFSHRAVD